MTNADSAKAAPARPRALALDSISLQNVDTTVTYLRDYVQNADGIWMSGTLALFEAGDNGPETFLGQVHLTIEGDHVEAYFEAAVQ